MGDLEHLMTAVHEPSELELGRAVSTVSHAEK